MEDRNVLEIILYIVSTISQNFQEKEISTRSAPEFA
jgi:hypothetical protein